jgi:ribosomal protein S18 acetylase RimI-like enzyme
MIRVVDTGDAEGIETVRRLLGAYAEELGASIGAVLCLQGFEDELAGLPGRYAGPGGCLLLADDGGEPVGCVAMRDLGGGTCEMKRLYVARAGRGKGVGAALVDEVLDRAREAGYRRMVLDSVAGVMGSAVALYRARGFEETEPYNDHPVEGTIYLAKSLKEDER